MSPHIEERLELLESMLDREGEGMEENNRHNKRSAEPLAEQVTIHPILEISCQTFSFNFFASNIPQVKLLKCLFCH